LFAAATSLMLLENVLVLWLCVCVCVCVILLILDSKLMAYNETSVDMSLNISLKFPSDTNLVMTWKEMTLEPLIVCCVCNICKVISFLYKTK
jgi:hypothetical protein